MERVRQAGRGRPERHRGLQGAVPNERAAIAANPSTNPADELNAPPAEILPAVQHHLQRAGAERHACEGKPENGGASAQGDAGSRRWQRRSRRGNSARGPECP
jgi:hypothetical protein